MNPSEEAQQKATILFMVRGIVEKYGGTVTVDLETDTLNLLALPAGFVHENISG